MDPGAGIEPAFGASETPGLPLADPGTDCFTLGSGGGDRTRIASVKGSRPAVGRPRNRQPGSGGAGAGRGASRRTVPPPLRPGRSPRIDRGCRRCAAERHPPIVRGCPDKAPQPAPAPPELICMDLCEPRASASGPGTRCRIHAQHFAGLPPYCSTRLLTRGSHRSVQAMSRRKKSGRGGTRTLTNRVRAGCACR